MIKKNQIWSSCKILQDNEDDSLLYKIMHGNTGEIQGNTELLWGKLGIWYKREESNLSYVEREKEEWIKINRVQCWLIKVD